MKYYGSTIPATLAEKLKEKGMPMILWQIGNNTDYVEVIEMRQEIFDESQVYKVGIRYNLPTYAEIFDWLMSEKRLDIIIKPYWNTDSWESYVTKIPEIDLPKGIREIYVHPTWHEAANAAIEKALTLI